VFHTHVLAWSGSVIDFDRTGAADSREDIASAPLRGIERRILVTDPGPRKL